ncbi:alpha/beta hydrolase [Frankia sp. B2]|nr:MULTISPECIES: alpha/beta fold hydrolase [Frankia]ETA03461.1 putative esterase [Frankia sp. CcI6]KDA40979.1 putative esterase of the alpha/beta hydrolase fold [Frankia sp. BMG5.23]KEZ34501.1 putative esterase of the alpha/beta hydrolase fold [Frankia sp. CeD]KFB03614.1 putative esterase of the alpha/beta hydrolase fold [Frankia sp. Allo2]TFE32877.1 alpha/beta hydrolase [Frankia sp. B2]
MEPADGMEPAGGGEPAVTYVFIAGIGNSGPEHWQYMWYKRAGNGVWVDHESWDNPVRDAWVKDLDDVLTAIDGPKILIAHSLGCTLVTEWACEHADDAITGAFLVAVPDVGGPRFPTGAVGFGPPRHDPLPFPTVIVASENDPYGSLAHSVAAAGRLGARLVNVGSRGHLNADSGLADWPAGWSVFRDHFAG